MERRVVITGLGAVTCLGNTLKETWDLILKGETGIDTVTYFDPTPFRTHMAGQVKNFDIEKYMPIKEARRLDPFCQFAIAAAEEALENAGITKNISESLNPERVGVLVSSGIGGLQTMQEQADILREKGPSKVSPFFIPMMIADLAAGNIAMRYGAKGPNMGIVTACASSTHSIGEAFWMIKRDDADVMIVGGAEASITPVGFGGFCAMKAMSQRNDDPKTASRPFDKGRDGFVMGEGSGILIMEELEHAKKRGANILAEIVGYGASADAHHITAPAPGASGAVQAINMAFKHARIPVTDVNYINAHGTSTPLNDKFETAAYKTVFGNHAKSISISSLKGSIGHNLGAAGALETVCAVKGISEDIVPQTLNYSELDPECDLDYTPNAPRKLKINTVLKVNMGFGGHNAALLLKKFK